MMTAKQEEYARRYVKWERLPRTISEAMLASLDHERTLRQQADEANNTLLAILDAFASRLTAEESAEVARQMAKAVRR